MRNNKSNKSRRGNTKFRNSKPKSDNLKREKDFREEAPSKSDNHPWWYAADPAILRDAASIAFSWPTGASKIYDESKFSSYGSAPYSDVPGILSFRTVPSIGTNDEATDPINVASQSVYSFVRHANSGHSNYDAPDLMLYILAMCDMYSFLVWCQRNYGYALTYDQRNRYIPRDLLLANNVDPDDMVKHLADFRFWMNTLIAKMASFAVPGSMNIFHRMAFLYAGFYCEGTSIKEQLYQLIPDGFRQFDLDEDQAGMLKYVQLDRTTPMKVEDIITYGNTMFGAIWDQEDFGIMSGDILKAYGDNIIKLESVPEAYKLIPTMDTMVLTQFKNTRLLNAGGPDIKQDVAKGILKSTITPHVYSTSDKTISGYNISADTAAMLTGIRTAEFENTNPLTVDTDDPTPEVIIEATRLKYGYNPVDQEIHCGTEFVRSLLVSYQPGQFMEIDQINIDYTAYLMDMLKVVERTRAFHYCPMYVMVVSGGTDNDPSTKYVSYIFDIDNFAVLDNADIIKMNTAAVINLYAVPSIGKITIQ